MLQKIRKSEFVAKTQFIYTVKKSEKFRIKVGRGAGSARGFSIEYFLKTIKLG